MQGGIDTESLEEILVREEMEEQNEIVGEQTNETCKAQKKRKISLKYKLCDLLPGIPEPKYKFWSGMGQIVWNRYPWLIGGQTIPILNSTLRLEWVWDGDVERGYAWVRQWVEKGALNYPRTGHITRLINEQIWACGGVTSGETYEQTNQGIWDFKYALTV